MSWRPVTARTNSLLEGVLPLLLAASTPMLNRQSKQFEMRAETSSCMQMVCSDASQKYERKPTIGCSVRDNYICMLPIKVGDDLLCCNFTGDVSLYLCNTFYRCHRLQVNSNNFGCRVFSARKMLQSHALTAYAPVEHAEVISSSSKCNVHLPAWTAGRYSRLLSTCM